MKSSHFLKNLFLSTALASALMPALGYAGINEKDKDHDDAPPASSQGSRFTSKNRELFDTAMYDNQLSTVQEFISKGLVDLNQVTYTQTALMHAVSLGYPEMVALILDQDEVQSNKTDDYGQNVLHLAARIGEDFGNKQGGMYVINEIFKAIRAKKKSMDGFDVNAVSKRGFTPFMAAARNGRIKSFYNLLCQDEVKFDSRMEGKNFVHMLVHASREGKENIHNFFSSLKANPRIALDLKTGKNAGIYEEYINMADDLGKLPLHYAAEDANGHLYLSHLMSYRNRDSRDNDNETPLTLAIQKGNVKVVKALLDLGCDPDVHGKSNKSPLEEAIDSQNTQIVGMMFEFGAHRFADLEALLARTVRTGNVDLVRVILPFYQRNLQSSYSVLPGISKIPGAAPSLAEILKTPGISQESKNRALIAAASACQKENVNVLLASKADFKVIAQNLNEIIARVDDPLYPDAQKKDFLSFLLEKVSQDKKNKMIVDLLGCAHDEDLKGFWQEFVGHLLGQGDVGTLLHAAIQESAPGAVQVILQKGNPTITMDHMKAVMDQDFSIVFGDLLGRFTHAKDRESLLFYAVEPRTHTPTPSSDPEDLLKDLLKSLRSTQKSPNFIKALIDAGVDPNATNAAGETPLYRAIAQGNTEAYELLNPHFSDGTGLLGKVGPLHLAYQNQQFGVVCHMLAKGMNIDARDALGRTPLHVMAMKGDLKTVNYLVRDGARTVIQDDARYLPIQYARAYGHHDVAKFLWNAAEPDQKEFYKRHDATLASLEDDADSSGASTSGDHGEGLKKRLERDQIQAALATLQQLLGFDNKEAFIEETRTVLRAMKKRPEQEMPKKNSTGGSSGDETTVVSLKTEGGISAHRFLQESGKEILLPKEKEPETSTDRARREAEVERSKAKRNKITINMDATQWSNYKKKALFFRNTLGAELQPSAWADFKDLDVTQQHSVLLRLADLKNGVTVTGMERLKGQSIDGVPQDRLENGEIWSVPIVGLNRLVYARDGENITVYRSGGHYGDHITTLEIQQKKAKGKGKGKNS